MKEDDLLIEKVNDYFARNNLNREISVLGLEKHGYSYPVVVTNMPDDVYYRVIAKNPWLKANGWNNELIVTRNGFALKFDW